MIRSYSKTNKQYYLIQPFGKLELLFSTKTWCGIKEYYSVGWKKPGELVGGWKVKKGQFTHKDMKEIKEWASKEYDMIFDKKNT